MRRLSPLTLFVLSAFGWIVALTAAWSAVSAWTSYPVGVLSHMALEQGAPMWVRQVRLSPGTMEVDTALSVPVAQAQGRRGEVSIEMRPAHYAYGLPIFLALVFAARGKGRWSRAVGGYVLLLPFQAFSLTMSALMQMVLAAQTDIRLLRIDPWQMEAIIYGYQWGSLVVPTLAPIVLWLWMDRQFVRDVLVRGWRGASPVAPS